MSLVPKIKRAVGGEATPKTVVLEILRRSRASIMCWRERATVEQRATQVARLRPAFAQLTPCQLLEHFQNRTKPHFLAGFSAPLNVISDLQQRLFPDETT